MRQAIGRDSIPQVLEKASGDWVQGLVPVDRSKNYGYLRWVLACSASLKEIEPASSRNRPDCSSPPVALRRIQANSPIQIGRRFELEDQCVFARGKPAISRGTLQDVEVEKRLERRGQ